MTPHPEEVLRAAVSALEQLDADIRGLGPDSWSGLLAPDEVELYDAADAALAVLNESAHRAAGGDRAALESLPEKAEAALEAARLFHVRLSENMKAKTGG